MARAALLLRPGPHNHQPMRIPLTSPARKVPLVTACALLLSGYLWFRPRQTGGRLLFRTARSCQFAESGPVATGQRGLSYIAWRRYFFLITQTNSRSCGGIFSCSSRTKSDYQARYWFDLAVRISSWATPTHRRRLWNAASCFSPQSPPPSSLAAEAGEIGVAGRPTRPYWDSPRGHQPPLPPAAVRLCWLGQA